MLGFGSQFSLSLPYGITCKVQNMCRSVRGDDISRMSKIHHVFHQSFDVESSYPIIFVRDVNQFGESCR